MTTMSTICAASSHTASATSHRRIRPSGTRKAGARAASRTGATIPLVLNQFVGGREDTVTCDNSRGWKVRMV